VKASCKRYTAGTAEQKGAGTTVTSVGIVIVGLAMITMTTTITMSMMAMGMDTVRILMVRTPMVVTPTAMGIPPLC